MLLNLLPMSIQSFQVTHWRHSTVSLTHTKLIKKEKSFKSRGFQTFQAMTPTFYILHQFRTPKAKNINNNLKIVIQSSKVILIHVKFPFILALELQVYALLN